MDEHGDRIRLDQAATAGGALFALLVKRLAAAAEDEPFFVRDDAELVEAGGDVPLANAMFEGRVASRIRPLHVLQWAADRLGAASWADEAGDKVEAEAARTDAAAACESVERGILTQEQIDYMLEIEFLEGDMASEEVDDGVDRIVPTVHPRDAFRRLGPRADRKPDRSPRSTRSRAREVRRRSSAQRRRTPARQGDDPHHLAVSRGAVAA
jgi:hypothetical protein